MRNRWSRSASMRSVSSISSTQSRLPSRGRPSASPTSSTTGFKQQQLAPRRRFLGAAKAQRVVAEVDGAVERGDELGRKALHGRIGDGRQAIRQELGVGQHAAQVVVDLAHREAELRQPRLLQQRTGELPLHLAQLALGDADLVVAAGGHDDALRILGILPELHHGARDAHHRTHQQPAEREVDERRGGQRDDDRHAEDVQRVGAQGRLQRRLRHDDLDEVVGIVADAAEHADGAAVRREEHGDAHRRSAPAAARCCPTGLPAAGADRSARRWSSAGRRGSTSRRTPWRREAMAFTCAVRSISARRPGGDVAAGETFGGQRGELGGGQALIQPVDAEGRDRRQEDQHLGQQHEDGRQHQQLGRQPQVAPIAAVSLRPSRARAAATNARPTSTAAPRFCCRGARASSRCRDAYPNLARKFITLRKRGLEGAVAK